MHSCLSLIVLPNLVDPVRQSTTVLSQWLASFLRFQAWFLHPHKSLLFGGRQGQSLRESNNESRSLRQSTRGGVLLDLATLEVPFAFSFSVSSLPLFSWLLTMPPEEADDEEVYDEDGDSDFGTGPSSASFFASVIFESSTAPAQPTVESTSFARWRLFCHLHLMLLLWLLSSLHCQYSENAFSVKNLAVCGYCQFSKVEVPWESIQLDLQKEE